MSPTAFRLVIVAICLLGVGLRPACGVSPPVIPALDPDQPLSAAERDQRLAAVQRGMTPDQVRGLIGAPHHVCRQILYHRCVEQWIYDSVFQLRLEFDRPLGQEARLQSVQPLVMPGN